MPLPFPFTTYGANRSSNTPSDPSCDFTYCYGGDWVQGKVGNYGMSFNGSDEYILSDTLNAQYTNVITIAGWVKADNFAGNMVIASEYRYTSANQRGWAIRTNTSGKIDVFATSAGDWTSPYISLTGTGTALVAGTWTHVAVVIDASTPTAKIYINGSLDQSGGGTGAAFNIYDSPVGYTLGGYWSGATLVEIFAGELDEMAVWNVELTSTKIAALYNSGAGARSDSITPPPIGRGDWVTGKVDDYALQFAASDTNRVTLPLGATTGSYNGQSGSISAWINRTAVGSYPMIFSTAKSGGVTDYGYFAIWSNTDSYENKLVWRQYINTSTQVNTQYSAGTIPADSNWYHVVLTCDGTNTGFYINGTASAATTTGGSDGAWFADTDEMNTALIGNLDYNGVLFEYPFPGKIDEVAVWNNALTAEDVLALYNDGTGAKSNSITTRDARWTVGKVDDLALKFDGGLGIATKEHVVLPIAAAGSTTSGSIAFWFKLRAIDSTGTNDEAILGISNGSTGTQFFEVHVKNQTSGTTTYIALSTSAEMAASLQTAQTVTAGDWFHMVITGNSSEAKMYLNGILVATDSSVSGWIDQLNLKDSFILGGLEWSIPVSCFDGQLDELAVYNVVLTLADAAILAGGVKANTVSSSALVSYYDMEDGTGTTLTDRTANGYNGTLTNFGTATSASLISYYDMENGMGTTLTDRTSNGFNGTLESMDTGTTGSLLVYYDWEIGDSNPVSGNFPTSRTVYDRNEAAFHPQAAHTGTMNVNMDVADWGAWDQGKIGKYAMNFTSSQNTTSTGNSIEIADSSDIQLENDMTVACWVYGTNQTWLQGIASKADSSAAVYHHGWVLGRNSSDNDAGIGANYWLFSPRTGATALYVASNAAGASNTWTHLVGTQRSGVNYLYVDGVQQTDTETLAIQDSGKALRIGQWWFQSAVGSETYHTDLYPWVGKVDEFSLWSGSLSDANISSLHTGAKANAITASVPTSLTGSWTTGKIGDYSIGLNQNGVDRLDPCEGISAASASAFPLGATVSSAGDGPAFSVAAWIYPTKLAGTLNVSDANYRVIVGRDGAGTTGYNGWKIAMDGASGKDGMISWSPGGYPSSGYNGRARSATGAIEINKWHLVVGVWDPSASGAEVKMYIYKEGVAVGTLVQTAYSSLTFTPGPGTDALSIGCYDYPEGPNLIFGWLGKIDDVGIWNVALDSGATNSLWNSGTGSAATTVSSSNLVSNWTMDSTYGTTTIVDGVAGNNGTLSNATMPTPVATLAAYLDFECNGPGNSIAKDLSGNDLSGTLKFMKTGSCGSG